MCYCGLTGMSWDLHEVCIEVASILQCMYLAVWRIENCNNGGAYYSTTIMPQYSARCCSSVFSKQPSHAGAKEIVTLKFGESLAPFEVFQPFFAMSEMLVLVAAPPKKRPNAEILHIGCVLGWGLHPAPTWMCENDSVPSRCYVSPCYGHPLCLAGRRWIRHDSAIQSESQVYHPGTHGCHTRCTHENMETCKIEHFIFETSNKS